MAIVAAVILGILIVAVLQLNGGTTGGDNPVPTADPDAGTIAALAAAAFTALSTLTAAYFGIKVAGAQGERSAATADLALKVAGDSTANRNPQKKDF